MKVISDLALNILKVNNVHVGHGETTIDFKRKQVEEVIERRVKNETTSLRVIYDEEIGR